MKNILVLTKIYPADDLKYGDTKVVHYFAKEWQKMGYNVKVIHNLILFPRIILIIAQKFQGFLASKFGGVVPFYYDDRIRNYRVENVDVCRIPILKFIPHGMFSKKRIQKQFNNILKELKKQNFVPDIVVGHWWNPQLELLSMLKEKFSCRTCLVVHNVSPKMNKNAYLQYFKNIDMWGMRSGNIQERFHCIFGNGFKSFLCFSGVPAKFISGNSLRSFNSNSISISFVGNLITRKHPLTILEAVKNVPEDNISCVNFIGDGAEREKLYDFAKRNDMLSKVNFFGKVSRERVSEELKKTDVFIMVSESEAFGLVYLEAMGAGCLTVASKNEGMDGLIVDGENGFLCKAGDDEELSLILKRIVKMDAEGRRKISDKALRTAMDNTDERAAMNYLKFVEG